jgi:hypothetical protein
MKRLIVVLFSLVVSLVSSLEMEVPMATPDTIITLHRDQTLYYFVPLDGDRATLKISVCGTEPSTGYEVLISYHGAAPVAVDVHFDQPQQQHHNRHLLDVEKLMFRTDSNGLIQVHKFLRFLFLIGSDQPLP